MLLRCLRETPGIGSKDAGSTPTASATGSASQAPGSSANAQGQAKKDQTATSSTGGSTQGSGDANANASQSGVKPTSSTAKGNHNTSCSTGGGTGSSATCTSTGSNAATTQTAAHSDASKRYGNGTTGAQIANSRGAPAGTNVYGPGNSQPHKVTETVLRGHAALTAKRQAERDQRNRRRNGEPEREAGEGQGALSDGLDGAENAALRPGVPLAGRRGRAEDATRVRRVVGRVTRVERATAGRP